jgi:hypothetical protein
MPRQLYEARRTPIGVGWYWPYVIALIASHTNNAIIDRTCPIYPYAKFARNGGSGQSDGAATLIPVEP